MGVETELVDELTAVVGVLCTVIVDTDVLTTVVVTGLVTLVVEGCVVTLEDVALVLAVEDATLELVLDEDTVTVVGEDTVVVVAACCPATGGLSGSRWNIPASGLITPDGPVPTAQPS